MLFTFQEKVCKLIDVSLKAHWKLEVSRSEIISTFTITNFEKKTTLLVIREVRIKFTLSLYMLYIRVYSKICFQATCLFQPTWVFRT